MVTRRSFVQTVGMLGASTMLTGCSGAGSRDNKLNLLCWNGLNSYRLTGPFKAQNIQVKIHPFTTLSQRDAVSRLAATEEFDEVWDVVEVKHPLLTKQLYASNLIKPLDTNAFLEYYNKMLPFFQGPYQDAMDESRKYILGMVQRFGSFNFVINSKKLSIRNAERDGFKLFLDKNMHGRYGIFLNDEWNVVHIALAADLDPRNKMNDNDIAKFKDIADTIFSNSRLITNVPGTLNERIVSGDIWAYFSGGVYTASTARVNGHNQVHAISPKSGVVDGLGSVYWAEIASVVNTVSVSKMAEEFIKYVQRPEIAKIVSFAESTHNPVAQMGNPEVFALYSKEDLNAIQWDDMMESVSRSFVYPIMPDYDKLLNSLEVVKNKYV